MTGYTCRLFTNCGLKAIVTFHLLLVSFTVAFMAQPQFYNTQDNNSIAFASSLMLPKVKLFQKSPASISFSIVLRNSNDDGDESSNEEPLSFSSEKERMQLIRQIEKSFYQNEGTGVQPPQRGSTLIQDLPLWRVQWTELPGYQNVLNVHVPHYINMFHKILNSKDVEDRYFGHIFLPGGSENMDNEEYSLSSAILEKDNEEKTKATLTGVLMKITDHTQFDDGRLVLIVQALERFRVVKVDRQRTLFPVATVEIIPDQELIETVEDRVIKEDEEDIVEDDVLDDDENDEMFLPEAVEEGFLWHPFEARPVLIKDCAVPVPNDKEGKPQSGQAVAVSPLMNYDASLINDRNTNITFRRNKDVKYTSAYSQTTFRRVMDLEYAVWVQLDELIQLLQRLISGGNNIISQEVSKIPIPTQILGLLPKEPPYPWPDQFSLEEYAIRMSNDKSATVGTDSRSAFVRVDDMDNYPPLRRAQRLSYVVWILTNSLALSGIALQDKQAVLEMESSALRLNAARIKLEQIGGIIRQVLDET